MQPYILVMEDEDALATLLQYNLEKEGYDVVVAADGEEGMLQIDERQPDLVLLDWMLPKLSGIEVCRRIRGKAETRNLPVIMLTARGEESDRVRGLDTGADDYLTKPFHTVELLARLRALLRRSAGIASATLSCGGLRLDPRAARANVNGEPLRLTSLEYRLLHYMMMHQGRVISRTELVEHLYDQDFDRDSTTIEVFIGRVRKKVGPDRIETVRGLGYRLTPLPGETEAA